MDNKERMKKGTGQWERWKDVKVERKEQQTETYLQRKHKMSKKGHGWGNIVVIVKGLASLYHFLKQFSNFMDNRITTLVVEWKSAQATCFKIIFISFRETQVNWPSVTLLPCSLACGQREDQGKLILQT